VASTAPSREAYRGLGSWVDIYDSKAWKDPSAAIADMASHGVRTLYLETSNSRSSFAMKDRARGTDYPNLSVRSPRFEKSGELVSGDARIVPPV